MAFRLVHARYDRQTQRAYVELRDADDDGGEMLASAIFSFRTCAGLTDRQIEQEIVPTVSRGRKFVALLAPRENTNQKS